jgi:AGZA family xanthine/uracil permease-like MFS transporter
MVLVGTLMMRNVKSIDWDDPIVCVMAFMTIVGIGLTASIANGIAVGTFVYVGGLCIAGRRKEISGVIWALTAVSALFVLTNYVVIPLWTS